MKATSFYEIAFMKSLLRFAMMALVLVVVALLSAVTAMRFAIHGQEVVVPGVIGLTPSDAERSVASLGLEIEVERQYYSPRIPEGHIVSQMPLPGTKVRRGWQLRVAQSMGPQRVSIPDVTKQSERAAELNLRRRGLEIASTAELQLPDTPSDQVIAQSPPPNASQVAAPKTSLLVTVAANSPAYVMPNFLGQPLGSVSRTLQDAGFKLGNVTVAPAPSTPPDASSPAATPPISLAPQPSPASLIVAQTPPAGQKVSAGAVVNFEVR
jgi:eukaryotic-like serine/threonine-protein kinase